MKRVGNSKEPTIQRMLNMASNLREKFGGVVILKLGVYQHSKMCVEIVYWFSVHSIAVHEHTRTWPEVIARYHELMKKGR